MTNKRRNYKDLRHLFESQKNTNHKIELDEKPQNLLVLASFLSSNSKFSNI